MASRNDASKKTVERLCHNNTIVATLSRMHTGKCKVPATHYTDTLKHHSRNLEWDEGSEIDFSSRNLYSRAHQQKR